MRRTILISTALCGSLLAGCGSDDPKNDAEGPQGDTQSQQTADSEEPAPGNLEDASSTELRPIEFLLPEVTEPPVGFRGIPSKCETESSASEYRGWYSFAVPQDWESGGVVGGSSEPLDEGTELSFGTGVDRATVEAETDAVQPDGTLGDGQGGPRTTFDYDYTVGEKSGTVTFEEFASVSIQGQDVTIVAAPHQQDPDFLPVTEYKARIKAANVFGRFQDPDLAHESSFVVTIKPTKADKELSKDLVTQIVGSYAMPQCARDFVVISQEVQTQRDVDGDGEVATSEDLREAMSLQ